MTYRQLIQSYDDLHAKTLGYEKEARAKAQDPCANPDVVLGRQYYPQWRDVLANPSWPLWCLEMPEKCAVFLAGAKKEEVVRQVTYLCANNDPSGRSQDMVELWCWFRRPQFGFLEYRGGFNPVAATVCKIMETECEFRTKNYTDMRMSPQAYYANGARSCSCESCDWLNNCKHMFSYGARLRLAPDASPPQWFIKLCLFIRESSQETAEALLESLSAAVYGKDHALNQIYQAEEQIDHRFRGKHP